MNLPNHHSKVLHTDASFKGMAKILQTELTTASPLFRKISDELKTKDSIPYDNNSKSYSQHSKPHIMKDVSPTLLPPPPSTSTRIRPSSVIVNDSKTWYQFEPSIPFPAQTLPQKPTSKPIDKGACDVKRLQDEMATLRKELAAMSDIMREGDEWLQRSSAEVKELAREQKKFESLTSQQFKNSNNVAQKRLSSPVNGYHMKQISPPPLPKSPRPNANPVIQNSPIKNNTFPPTPPPPQTTTSIKYERNGIGLIENGYRRDLAQPPSPKPIKTCAPVNKLTNETHPENEIKSDSVRRMSSFFESKPQSTTTLDDRRKSYAVSESSTRKLSPRSELSTSPLQRVNKPGKLPPPLSPKPNHDNAFKNGCAARERPPLSPKPAGIMGKPVTANRVQNIVKEQAESLLVQRQKSDSKIIIYPPMPSNQSLSPLPPPPIPTPPETVNNRDKITMRPISPSALSPKLSNGTTNLLLEEIRQFKKKSRPDSIENIEESTTSEEEPNHLYSDSDSASTASPVSPIETSKRTSSELLQEIRQFKQSGHSLRKVSDESAESTPQRRRKNSMHDVLQTRFQAFCGIGSDSSSSEDELDEDGQWED